MKRKNGECAACLKYSVLIVVEKKDSGTPVLYIGRTVLKGQRNNRNNIHGATVRKRARRIL